jgi:hypothetical protein
MEKFSGRAADPVDDTVLVPFDGSQLAADANPTVWSLAVRWGSTIHTVTADVPAFDLQRHRSEATHALCTDVGDARIHGEVDTDVAAAVRRGASQLVPVPRAES